MLEIDNNQELKALLKKNKRVLALFYASWCPYCRGFLTAFEKAIAKRDFGCVLYVNLDDYDNSLWEEYSVEAVPTIIFFENGLCCRRLDGKLGEGLSGKQLKEWLLSY